MWRLLSRITVLASLALIVPAAALAKDPPYRQKGVLADMQSVSCGYMQKSGTTVAGALITGAQHTKSRELLCQEYTLKADRVTYRIRPKEEKHPVLLPVGELAEFRLKKDELLLRIPETDNKEREYIVVAMTASSELASEIADTQHAPKPHASKRLPPPDVSASPPSPAPEPVAAQSAPVDTTGSVQVQSVPAGAEVFVDSTRVGQTPAVLTLKPGPHSIQVVMPGYKDWVADVSVASGAQQQVTATLSR